MATSAKRSIRQRTSFLDIFQYSMLGITDIDDVSCIVCGLVYTLGYIPPRWRDLTPLEKFAMEQNAGHQLGINLALTFDISDQQRIEWTQKHKNLLEGFKKEVLKKVRHILGNNPCFWIVIEPSVARGKKGKEYVDTPTSLRRFDIHAGFRIKHHQISAFQNAIYRQTEKLQLKAKPSPAHRLKIKSSKTNSRPLQMKGRMAYARPIQGIGWTTYSTKIIKKTIKRHADLTSNKPFGRSRNLTEAAQATYEQIRQDAQSIGLSYNAIKKLDDYVIRPDVQYNRTNRSVDEACKALLLKTIDELDPSTYLPTELDHIMKLKTAGPDAVRNWAVYEVSFLVRHTAANK